MAVIRISKTDSIVIVDGLGFRVDCSDLPKGFHMLEYFDPDIYGKGEAWGEIQWVDERGLVDIKRPNRANERITNFGPYRKYIERWDVEKAKYDAAVKLAREAAEKVEAARRERGPVDVVE